VLEVRLSGTGRFTVVQNNLTSKTYIHLLRGNNDETNATSRRARR
jgi:hypothetical protein